MVTATGKRDKITFRMSSIGKCPRALSAELLGYEAQPMPAFVMQAAEEGNWHESRIKQELSKGSEVTIGIEVYDEQQEIILEYPSFILKGHIDGKVRNFPTSFNKNAPEEKLLEIKTMSQFEFDRWMKGRFTVFPNYADQATVYMEATGLSECLYIVKNRSSGYEDRQVLTEQPSFMTEIIGKLTDVTNHVMGNELVPREPDINSIECRRCNFKDLCIPEPDKLTVLEAQVLLDITNNWRTGKSLVKQGQSIIDETKKALEEHTRATGINKWGFNKLAMQLIQVKEGEVSYTRKASEYLKITDLDRGND